MTDYYTVNDFEYQTIVRRSRFLTVLKSVETEDDAVVFLEEIRSKYRDATHVCYAYRIGERAECTRFSDAGEPQGTAGKPILEALVAARVTFSLAAVVRWFGGVKLGSGGLTRAYHSAVAEAIEAGGRELYTLCNVYDLECPLSLYSPLVRTIEKLGGAIMSREFAQTAKITAAVPIDQNTDTAFVSAVKDMSGGSVTVSFGGARFFSGIKPALP